MHIHVCNYIHIDAYIYIYIRIAEVVKGGKGREGVAWRSPAGASRTWPSAPIIF